MDKQKPTKRKLVSIDVKYKAIIDIENGAKNQK